MKNAKSPDEPLTPFERACVAFSFCGIVVIAFFLIVALCGCSHTGVRVVASSASYTNIGDINWDEYKIPVLSVYLGPKATVWINKDYTCVSDIEVSGVVTNDTAALAIYDSHEAKSLRMRMHFNPLANTNGVKEVVK